MEDRESNVASEILFRSHHTYNKIPRNKNVNMSKHITGWDRDNNKLLKPDTQTYTIKIPDNMGNMTGFLKPNSGSALYHISILHEYLPCNIVDTNDHSTCMMVYKCFPHVHPATGV